MAEALAKGSTTVITNGSITSNLARTTALVARRLGLKCVLVLNGGDPKSARANSRVAELLDVDVYGVNSRQERDEKMAEVAESLEREGEVLGGAVKPALQQLFGRHPVEGVVDFDRRKPLGIEREHLVSAELIRVEVAAPFGIVVAGRPHVNVVAHRRSLTLR